MIYSKEGNQLTNCYGKNGTAANIAYAMDGSVAYRKQTDPIQLSDIASYYQSDVSAEVTSLNSLSDDYVAFIICTDIHSAENSQNSQNIIRYLLKNSKADKCFLLGDYSRNLWSEEEYVTYATPLAENCSDQVYATLGNHEWFGNTSISNLHVIYDDFLADKSLNGNTSSYYYYFDDNAKQIRYIVLNTADYTQNAVSASQIEWLRNAVNLPTSSWKVIVLGHHSLTGEDGIMADTSSASSTIISLLNSCNGTVVGYFCGHGHCDWIYDPVDGGFIVASLADDSRQMTRYYTDYGVPYPANRTSGTVNEQAITIVKVNTATQTVSFDRIGAVYMNPSDMAYTY